MTDMDRTEDLPDRYGAAARARQSAIDRMRLAKDNMAEDETNNLLQRVRSWLFD